MFVFVQLYLFNFMRGSDGRTGERDDTNSEAYGILVVVEGAVAIIVARYDT